MTCRYMRRELVERARRGTELRSDMAQHVETCATCAELWDAGRGLTSHLQRLRAALESGRAAAPARFRLAALLARERRRSRYRRTTAWVLSAAAVLALALAGREVWNGEQHPPPVTRQAVIRAAADGDYVDVPYALPLAPGELMSVVRLELPASAFVRMGFAPIQSADRTVTADLVIGEDGLPRAVRLVNGDQDSTLN
jgi:hypothetical protein